MIDFGRFTHLTFDCYGTLIDWETGILDAVAPVLGRHGAAVEPEKVLRLYTKYETGLEMEPYRSYRDVLRGVMAGIATELGFVPSVSDLEALPDSVGSWPAFPDTAEALRCLKSRYRLVILSNIDDALFAQTAKQLKVEFDEIITAEQVRSYKPAPEHFRVALRPIPNR